MKPSSSKTVAVKALLVTTVGLGACAILLVGCQRCSGSNIEKRGDATIWESIPFGISEQEFIEKAAALMTVAPAPPKDTVCKTQLSMSYPDLGEGEIRERSASGKILTNCTIRSHRAMQTSTLLELKGEFISGTLSRVSYRIAESQLENVRTTLTSRFGAGDTIILKEQVIIEDTPVQYQAWHDAKEAWLLTTTPEKTVLLIHQDLPSGATLKSPEPAAERGKPVSLEDIGIGALDLNAPLPDLGALERSDAGANSKAPSL